MHRSNLLVYQGLDWFQQRHVSVVGHLGDVGLMLKQLFLYFSHLVDGGLRYKIGLVYLIVDCGLQVLEPHEVVRLLTPLVEGQRDMVVDVAHHVDLPLVNRLRTNWCGHFRQVPEAYDRTNCGSFLLIRHRVHLDHRFLIAHASDISSLRHPPVHLYLVYASLSVLQEISELH